VKECIGGRLIMKKLTLFICFCLFFLGTTTFAQEVGEKVYKEVIFDGKKINKWLAVTTIAEYDAKGNEIHTKMAEGTEWWIEYDDKGNQIHVRYSDGLEEWNEYDDKGNLIYEKHSDGNAAPLWRRHINCLRHDHSASKRRALCERFYAGIGVRWTSTRLGF